ncbi:hypothetical protein BC629DRAFT_1531191 [Irpex lacteus]|nr:hypothetical protein BC629DRAFT_1531191 [Irpex lacteus]
MATRILSRIRPPASNSDAMSSGVFSLPPCCAHSPSNPPPLQSDSSRTASAQTVSTPRGIRLAKSSRSKENTHQSVNRPTCSSACCMSPPRPPPALYASTSPPLPPLFRLPPLPRTSRLSSQPPLPLWSIAPFLPPSPSTLPHSRRSTHVPALRAPKWTAD